MRIDLHTHSSVSDGTDRPAEVMRRARAAGLDVVALTDHDTVAGHAEAGAALPPGLTLVPGMELSCRIGGHSVHLLAYLFDPAEPDLAAQRRRIRDDRVRRAREMTRRIAALGVPLTWDTVSGLAAGGTVGRPHIARALLEVGAIDRFEDAFTTDWLAPGGRAYVTRYALDPEEAVRLVRRAGGVCVLAHPRVDRGGWALPDERIAALAAAGLAGVEVDHPGQDPDRRAPLRALAADLGLVVTGSSDDHGALTGHRLGCETTDPDAYEALRAAATGARPVFR